MVVETTTIVANSSVFQIQINQNVFDIFAFHVGTSYGGIQVGSVGIVVFRMMYFHSSRINMWF